MMLCVELLGAQANSGWISLHLAGSLQDFSFQWSTAMMETQIRPYFCSNVRHPGGTHQITPSD